VFVTEKTWKPIVFGRPFVMYATPTHEDFLESLGFSVGTKTMGDPVLAAEAIKMMVMGDGEIDSIHVTENRRVADPHRWTSKLYSWLDRTVRD
jgi:hypothetical protein